MSSEQERPQLLEKVATGKKLPVTNALVLSLGIVVSAAGLGFERGWLPSLGKKAESPICVGDIRAAENSHISIQIGATPPAKMDEIAPLKQNEPNQLQAYSLRPPLEFYSPIPLAPIIAQEEAQKGQPKSSPKQVPDSMITRRYYLVPEEGMAFTNRKLQTGLCVFAPYLQCWMPKGFGAEIPVRPQ